MEDKKQEKQERENQLNSLEKILPGIKEEFEWKSVEVWGMYMGSSVEDYIYGQTKNYHYVVANRGWENWGSSLGKGNVLEVYSLPANNPENKKYDRREIKGSNIDNPARDRKWNCPYKAHVEKVDEDKIKVYWANSSNEKVSLEIEVNLERKNNSGAKNGK